MQVQGRMHLTTQRQLEILVKTPYKFDQLTKGDHLLVCYIKNTTPPCRYQENKMKAFISVKTKKKGFCACEMLRYASYVQKDCCMQA